MVTANLGPLTIAHPENWHVFTPRQKGEGITIAPHAGVTGDEIGYGVVISGVAPKPGERLYGQPQKERDWLVTVPTPDGAVIGFVFVAPEAQFDRFRPTFESMLSSLHF